MPKINGNITLMPPLKALCVCMHILLFIFLSMLSYPQHQFCYNNLVKDEYYFSPPSHFAKYNNTYLKSCSADVFLPNNDL